MLCTYSNSMAVNRYLPFALLYFFFNSAGLPFGLTYTALLAPLFYWWVLKTGRKEFLLPFFIALFPFLLIQVLFVGVDDKTYFISLLNLITVFTFCTAVYTFLKICGDVGQIFRRIVMVNFVFCILAILFYFSPYSYLFWTNRTLTEGVDNFLRLRLFTYEPSYYATLFVPFFFFYFLKIFLNQNRTNSWVLLIMIVLPFILSFSLGVMSAILLSIIVVFALYFNRLIVKKRVRNFMLLAVTIIVPSIVIGVIFFPNNTLLLRIDNIIAGHDSSGKGRTFDAFFLATKILELKSSIWGIGLGQIKIIGVEVIKDFYLYPANYKTVAIPNVTAETLTIFGYAGLFIRFAIEIGLFLYTRVWKNYYRILLFMFIFIYQFGGSFITNVAEYVVWILAFTNVFTQFDVLQKEEAALSLYE